MLVWYPHFHLWKIYLFMSFISRFSLLLRPTVAYNIFPLLHFIITTILWSRSVLEYDTEPWSLSKLPWQCRDSFTWLQFLWTWFQVQFPPELCKGAAGIPEDRSSKLLLPSSEQVDQYLQDMHWKPETVKYLTVWLPYSRRHGKMVFWTLPHHAVQQDPCSSIDS